MGGIISPDFRLEWWSNLFGGGGCLSSGIFANLPVEHERKRTQKCLPKLDGQYPTYIREPIRCPFTNVLSQNCFAESENNAPNFGQNRELKEKKLETQTILTI